jgi:hypothetical protein
MQPNLPQQPMGPNPYAEFMPSPQQVKPAKRSPVTVIVIGLLVFLLVVFLGLFTWAYMSRQDYKNNSDKKSDIAAGKAVKIAEAAKEKDFAEREKNPYSAYNGAATYGSLHVVYPRTWSAYIIEKNNASTPIDGYVHPSFVPSADSGTNFALRFKIVSQPYAQSVKAFDADVKKGKVKASAYQLPKVQGVTGTRIDGEIKKGQKSSMVIFPLRDKTLEVWTESADFVNDFNSIILANFTFEP